MGELRVLLVHSALPEIGNIARPTKALFPSLTLAHVAALFPSTYELTVVNDIVEDIPYDQAFDLVGITFYGVATVRAFAIARRFRQKGIPVLFGGPTASVQPEYCRPHCDSIVIGEAEQVMERLVSDLEAGCLAPSYVAPGPSCIDHLPVPRYDLLNRRRYLGIYPVQTARGCVFRCSFCSIPRLNAYGVRYRPIDEVIRDVQAAISQSGQRQIFFVDDNINMNPKRACELLEALIPLRISWYSYASSLIGTQPEVLRLAADSGCRMLFLGFESLASEHLKNVNKPFNHPETYQQIIDAIHDHGIHIMPGFIFGLDGDDASAFQATLDFVHRRRLSFPVFHILTPTPGTATYDQLEASGRITERNLDVYDGRHVVYEPLGMDASQLATGYRWINRKCYSLASIARRTLLRRPIGGWRRLRVQLRMVVLNLYCWWLMRRGYLGMA